MILGLALNEGKLAQLHQATLHGVYKYIKIYNAVFHILSFRIGFFYCFITKSAIQGLLPPVSSPLYKMLSTPPIPLSTFKSAEAGVF